MDRSTQKGAFNIDVQLNWLINVQHSVVIGHVGFEHSLASPLFAHILIQFFCSFDVHPLIVVVVVVVLCTNNRSSDIFADCMFSFPTENWMHGIIWLHWKGNWWINSGYCINWKFEMVLFNFRSNLTVLQQKVFFYIAAVALLLSHNRKQWYSLVYCALVICFNMKEEWREEKKKKLAKHGEEETSTVAN